ncbi:MAG: M20/M25/M40 family metallo-hydrolase [Ignavibacteriae bacterium]|nr:M20/M25/M40 family metallo-hydrolase [Ignavibacteriota bacterium]
MLKTAGCVLCFLSFLLEPCFAQTLNATHESIARKLLEQGLTQPESYTMLSELCVNAPHRLSGYEDAQRAVQLTKKMMTDRGFVNVHLEKIMVPRWVRGKEEAYIVPAPSLKQKQSMRVQKLSVCALGGSIATPESGIDAEVVEVKTLDEARALGSRGKGKIVFFNRAFDPTKLNAFAAYGGAVDQRSRGAIVAAQVGAVAVLVRSMTGRPDDVPHTGAMNYVDTVKKIPAAAVSIEGAELLSASLARGQARVRLTLTCKTLPDVESANVVGEIAGSEKPNEIIVVGGHLDCWDKGQGAHDDGAGCMQAIEVVNLIKKIGIRPKRTIRAVMFMNEENGNRGGRGYPVAAERKGEKHVAALESDRGGFTPRGFTVAGDSSVQKKVLEWKPYFDLLDASRIEPGYGGVDIAPLLDTGVPGFGLYVDSHRYFDYHHSDNDTIDKVNPRELELGAIVEAMICYLISEEGL